MVDPKALIQASVEAGKDLLRPPGQGAPVTGPKPAPVLIPIRSLGANHRERIAKHLLALDGHDRYLRFGYMANDEQISRYVDGLDFERDEIFGVYNRKLELIAVAHLAYCQSPEQGAFVEFGVSVAKSARGRGFGARLFDRAVMHARNDGAGLMLIHALSENTAMLKIARNAGATLDYDGSETEAFLRLPPATLDTRMTELVDEHIAQTDYRLKQQAKQFWDFLAEVQQVRRDVQDAQKKTPV